MKSKIEVSKTFENLKNLHPDLLEPFHHIKTLGNIRDINELIRIVEAVESDSEYKRIVFNSFVTPLLDRKSHRNRIIENTYQLLKLAEYFPEEQETETLFKLFQKSLGNGEAIFNLLFDSYASSNNSAYHSTNFTMLLENLLKIFLKDEHKEYFADLFFNDLLRSFEYELLRFIDAYSLRKIAQLFPDHLDMIFDAVFEKINLLSELKDSYAHDWEKGLYNREKDMKISYINGVKEKVVGELYKFNHLIDIFETSDQAEILSKFFMELLSKLSVQERLEKLYDIYAFDNGFSKALSYFSKTSARSRILELFLGSLDGQTDLKAYDFNYIAEYCFDFEEEKERIFSKLIQALLNESLTQIESFFDFSKLLNTFSTNEQRDQLFQIFRDTFYYNLKKRSCISTRGGGIPYVADCFKALLKEHQAKTLIDIITWVPGDLKATLTRAFDLFQQLYRKDLFLENPFYLNIFAQLLLNNPREISKICVLKTKVTEEESNLKDLFLMIEMLFGEDFYFDEGFRRNQGLKSLLNRLRWSSIDENNLKFIQETTEKISIFLDYLELNFVFDRPELKFFFENLEKLILKLDEFLKKEDLSLSEEARGMIENLKELSEIVLEKMSDFSFAEEPVSVLSLFDLSLRALDLDDFSLYRLIEEAHQAELWYIGLDVSIQDFPQKVETLEDKKEIDNSIRITNP